MSKTYRIEELITIVDERNSDNKDLPLLGINLSKSFFPSVANVIGTDLSRYKVIRKGCFACNMMHVGRDMKVPIALYLDDNEAIISPAYPMFTVSDENIILPEFLMLFFKNSEFDREAGFYASAGIRGGFDWEDFSNITLPVPPISEQRRIVSEYQTVERRIKNNEAMIKKLEETAQAIYHHTFVEGIDENNLPEGWETLSVKDFCNIFTGKKDVNQSKTKGPYRFFSCSPDYFYSDEYIAEGPAVLISGNGSYTGRVSFYNAKFDLYQRKYACTPKENCEKYIHFIYAVMKYQFEKIKMGGTRGTSIPYIVMDDIADFPVSFHKHITSKFDNKMKRILRNIDCIERETSHLRTLLSLLTSKLS